MNIISVIELASQAPLLVRHLMRPPWHFAPERIKAVDGTIDVWRFQLPDAGSRNASHTARAAILQRYLDNDQPLKIGQRSGGKPYLASPIEGPEFNLSHTRSLGLLAVSRQVPVGIDVERIRFVRDPEQIAKRVLPSDVTDQFAMGSPESQLDFFFAHWTRFEALQKSAGRGVFESPVDPAGVQLHGFCPDDGFVAHVAAATEEPPVFRFFDLTDS